jgi:hypothetical protein
MKKNNLFLIFTVIAITAVAAFGAYRCGLFTDTESAETEFKGPELPLAFGSASDRTQGLYEVSYWLVQKGPIFNPSLLQQTALFYWPQTPVLKDVEAVVRIPKFISDRKYITCRDCPISVKVLRAPVKGEEPQADGPEKDKKI